MKKIDVNSKPKKILTSKDDANIAYRIKQISQELIKKNHIPSMHISMMAQYTITMPKN